MLEPGDTFEIYELLALFGHVIDGRQWNRLGEVFTEDVVSDATGVGLARTQGLARIMKNWSSQSRLADAHHTTNIILRQVDDWTVHAVSKGLSLYGTAEAHTVVHQDVIVRTGAGWRISARVTLSPAAQRAASPAATA